MWAGTHSLTASNTIIPGSLVPSYRAEWQRNSARMWAMNETVGHKCWPQRTFGGLRQQTTNLLVCTSLLPSGERKFGLASAKKKPPIHYSHYKWMSFYNHKKLKKCCSTLWFCFFNQCYKISHFLPTGTHSLKRLITEQQKCLISPMDWATHVRY